MKCLLMVFIFLSCFFLQVEAQLRQHNSAQLTCDNTESYFSALAAQKPSFNTRQRLTSPRLSQTLSSQNDGGASYWTSQITSQSYGNGKWGTYYYWDVQGNLREMRGFVDIAGKNKRGLKLVFPWH